MFEELFQRKKLNISKLLAYGFKCQENNYLYSTPILNNEFELHITMTETGQADTKVIEKDTREEYILYKTNATGAFVGEVRVACEEVLKEVAEQCFDVEIFKSEQTKMTISYVREKYGDEPEYLWKKFPENAIWRRKDNAKWYGAILTVSRRKLGLDSDEMVEILDLRMQKEMAGKILKREHYYPGWHMNKKSWYSIILDGSLADDEIYVCIDESYALAAKK